MTGPRSVLGLAERLGHPADARLLIVNCDDVGSSHAANLACEAAMRTGIATSGTLMVLCPWAREAVERFEGLDLGVHLTLTAEYDHYRWRSLTGAASLHDDEGYLPRTTAEALARAEPEDVRRECRAQIEQALAWGVDVTHLDAHMGVVQVDPRLAQIYVELAVEFRLPIRMPGVRHHELLQFDARVWAREAGVLFPDDFVAEWGEPTREVLARELPARPAGVSEFNIHPVFDGPELQAYDPREMHVRVHDQACAMDPEIAGWLRDSGFTAISYRPLRDLQRAAA